MWYNDSKGGDAEMTYMSTGDVLRELRMEKGLTSREVSEEVGIQKNVLTEYETGARNIGIKALMKLADYYDVSTDYILRRTDCSAMNNSDTLKQSIEQVSALKPMISSLQRVSAGLTGLREMSAELAEISVQMQEIIKSETDTQDA